jgi:hypothetical protein
VPKFYFSIWHKHSFVYSVKVYAIHLIRKKLQFYKPLFFWRQTVATAAQLSDQLLAFCLTVFPLCRPFRAFQLPISEPGLPGGIKSQFWDILEGLEMENYVILYSH